MDYTEGTEKHKHDRAKKQMLWFGIVSLCMTFAGLTSAYIVSMERRDWLESYEFPQALVISTLLIVLSSIAIHLAKNAIITGKKTLGTVLLLITIALAIAFIYFQRLGIFVELRDQGLFVAGKSSNITATFLFLIVVVHVAHIIAGMIALLVITINHIRGKYTPEDHLGLSLGVTFWHFVDLLWLFLFALLYLTK